MSNRNEDAVATFMSEWSQQQGYSKNIASKDGLKSISPKRIISELKDYPNNFHLAGSHSIWNPLVQGPKFHQTKSHNDYFASVIPTNPTVEVLRRRSYETFKRDCQDCLQRILKPWEIKMSIPSMLEKWHMDAKHEEEKKYFQTQGNRQQYPLLASTSRINALVRQEFDSYFDPILLSKEASYLFPQILKEEAIRAWNVKHKKDDNRTQPPKLEKKIVQVRKALVPLIMNSRENFAKQLQQAAKQNAMRSSGSKNKVPKVDLRESLVHVSFVGNTFKVHKAYHVKLQRLFDRHQQRRNEESEYTFEEAFFCLLCRYDTLQGAGLQAGVPGGIMDVLLDKLGCRMECFASPLNCRYERFASAFELDKLFGSFASFFNLPELPSGCYQANPPFCEGVIGALAAKMKELLSKSSEPLMFVVFVPAWKESKAYHQLLEHTHLTKHVLLEQGKHWYAEGTQHRRKESFRVASFDTSILMYQNESAKSKWQVDQQHLIDALSEAFCHNPGIMNKTITQESSTDAILMSKSNDVVTNKSLSSSKPKPVSSKPKNRGKKRSFVNQEEENRAHLDILERLGLAGSSNDQAIEKTGTKSFITKKSKKRKKKKVKS